jgi:hypothetical protein
MIDRIKCFIGLHKWRETIPSERKCIKCNKKQARVIYPWTSSRIYWETE